MKLLKKFRQSFLAKTLCLVLLLLFSLFFINTGANDQVKADHGTDHCEFVPKRFSGPLVGGYIYGTIEFASNQNGWGMGGEYLENCLMSGGRGMEYAPGRRADRIWIGAEAPDGVNNWSANLGSDTCTAQIPNPDPDGVQRVRHCDSSDGTSSGSFDPSTAAGDWDVFQDDASSIYILGSTVGNALIHCHGMGMGGTIFPGCQYDVYRNGNQNTNPNAIRGAGYFDYATTEISWLIPLNAAGRLNDITFQFRTRNTWTAGQGARLRLTLRYPPPEAPTPTTGNILGRVFVDNNYNGSYDAGDQLTQNPPGQCGSYANIPVNVFTSTKGETDVSKCNPQPYYLFSDVPEGWHMVELRNLPGGWSATTGPQNVYVPNGGDAHQWFGMAPRIPGPASSPYCSNDGNPGVNIGWVDPTGGPTSYFVDISTDPNFSWYWNKGVSGAFSTLATTGFSGGPMVAGTTYYMRIYYPNISGGVHGETASFVAQQPCGEFILEPISGTPTFTGPEDNPTAITFSTQIDAQGYKPPAGVTGTATRDFFWKRGGVVQGPLATTPLAGPNPETRRFITVNYSDQTTSLPSPQPGDEYCVRITINPHRGIAGSDGSILSITDPGKTSAESCKKVISRPYLKFYSGDIQAGSGFTEEACAPTTGSISAYVQSNKAGSGSHLGVFARGTVQEFASAALRPSSIKELTFANTSGTYGGGFNAASCVPDYFAMSSSATNYAGAVANLIALSGSYVKTGNLTLNPSPVGGVLSPGRKIVLYVDGDVYIQNRVGFTGPWANIDVIPSFYLIARGNIYINPNITQLDGTYMALPNSAGTGGTIYTCAPGFATYGVAQVVANCRDQLVVNGNFIAKKVKFLRMFGTVGLSNTTENPLGPAHNCGATVPPRPVCAGEVFVGGPESWLNLPPLGTDLTTEDEGYDAFTSLPPIL